jgi:diguanylate cyclase (GGDEF)-like protein
VDVTAGSDPGDVRKLIRALTHLAAQLHQSGKLEELLQQVVDTAANTLGVWRASLRLLDPSRQKLLVSVRAGSALHEDHSSDFPVGVGLIGWVAKHGQPLRTGDAAKDRRYVAREDMRDPMRSFLGVPLLSGAATLGVLSAVSPEANAFSEQDEEIFQLLAAISAPHVEIARLARLSTIDALTGVLAPSALEHALPSAAPASSDPVCVALIDIDRLRKINDTLGYAVGDELVRSVARILASHAPTGVVRTGGQEFVRVVPGMELAAACEVIERERRTIEAFVLNMGDTAVEVTVSAGVVQRKPGETRDALLERAGRTLRAAKQAGRNRVNTET